MQSLTKKVSILPLRIEKRGFYSPSGEWVNLNGKLILPKGSPVFGHLTKEAEVLKAKRILNNQYQQTLKELYNTSFPNPWLLEEI